MRLNFLKTKTQSLVKKNKALRANLPYTNAQTVGIIFTVEDKQKHFAVKDFIRKLEVDTKHIQVLEFLPAKTENYEFKFDFFSDKDLSFWGNITSPNALQFAETSFDFLFYIDLTANPLILHLLARSKAKCRIGKNFEGAQDFLELAIDSVDNTQALIDGMYKYATQLK
ncbi:DUF6913 domain-containing protein [Pseudochryseolinea flava]|uniref:Uncharacterized protein n=1 Tax=Pseudochryseolinea flava TaxID=2059302 RepID=A0A364XYV8_9BACT|nr:hypothetical protein [Pseudochryseolinea flava]RAV99526.1 hypothetical protein DQQ10_18145 [Pseudochryseolinea flava]